MADAKLTKVQSSLIKQAFQETRSCSDKIEAVEEKLDGKITSLDQKLNATFEKMEKMMKGISMVQSEVPLGNKDSGKPRDQPEEKAKKAVAEVDAVDVLRQFKELQQNSTVLDYEDRYEEVAFLMHSFYEFSEEFYLNSFISGLKPEIRDMFKVFKATSFAEAIALARIHEANFEEMDKEISGLDSDEDDSPLGGLFIIRGIAGRKNPLFIGLSNGCEVSFIHTQAAIESGLKMVKMPSPRYFTPILFGGDMVSQYMCPGFKWKMAGREFEFDLVVLDGGPPYDLVLGKDWIGKNKFIIRCDDKLQTSLYTKDGERIVLRTRKEDSVSPPGGLVDGCMSIRETTPVKVSRRQN